MPPSAAEESAVSASSPAPSPSPVLSSSLAPAPALGLDDLTHLFRLLSDETRLRLLSLLREDELAVGELQKVLGMGQSTLSTQLGLLRDQGLVASRKEGQKVLYRIPAALKDGPRYGLLDTALESARSAKWHERDQRHLRDIILERSRTSLDFFNSEANQNRPSPGQSWKSLSLGLLRLLSGRSIVDLGCGNGRLALLLAQSGNTVTGVDNSESQLRLARRALSEMRQQAPPAPPGKRPGDKGLLEALDFVLAPMEATGLPDRSFDLAFLSQSLHHAANPQEVLREAHRLLQPGGRILILDLLAHGEEWMQKKWGDFWLGFSADDLRALLQRAGFQEIETEIAGAARDFPQIESLNAWARRP